MIRLIKWLWNEHEVPVPGFIIVWVVFTMILAFIDLSVAIAGWLS